MNVAHAQSRQGFPSQGKDFVKSPFVAAAKARIAIDATIRPGQQFARRLVLGLARVHLAQHDCLLTKLFEPYHAD
jgi:hypothetical protein